MAHPPEVPDHPAHHRSYGPVLGTLMALWLSVDRRSVAEFVADLVELAPSDRIVDVGCGPGTAARVAARRCMTVTGVDPAPEMLRVARYLNALRGSRNVTLMQGPAEHLPLPDESATVVWALRSVHHWNNRIEGLAEAQRVLCPNGRLLVYEPLIKPGRPGGMTSDQFDQMKGEAEKAGFAEVSGESVSRPRDGLVNILPRRSLGTNEVDRDHTREWYHAKCLRASRQFRRASTRLRR